MDGRSLRTDYTGSSKGWFRKGEHGSRYGTGEAFRDKTCKICGKIFRHISPKKQTCSPRCEKILRNSHKKLIIRYCAFCHKEFSVPPAWVRRGEGNYCSRTCAFANKINYTDKQKQDARNRVMWALASQKIVKFPCAICKNPQVEAHHHRGYAKKHQLDIIWLCDLHHHQEHARLRRLGLTNLL